ncbi:cisplatin damage response ATP-dependent DNA ligase [Roseomonas gilardii subsp. gilardii]|uniref:cisplatin damage response ATP-dependent DNA ligase n=1 Tax=Roseomonas gilardii TaxID=257708 RepID=UPI001FFA14FF|nr:cisplatin damage response ATP-dependent DNA ligase [Roseomonas gilardii]UPG72300.1 cisplatin damage response ATP-dependent DNA ligase [Roseomonas gilardii subsp. gilardii]
MSLPAFAELLERLVFTPGRLAKLALIRRWFDEQPDPERGVGLAALTGELVFSAAKPSVIRALVAERTDPVLLALSQDYVGDFAETVALIWPEKPGTNAPPPMLSEVVEGLELASRAEVPRLIETWLDSLDGTGRFALIKLVTGALRVGVSARLARVALAEWAGRSVEEIEEVWHGVAPPYIPIFRWLEGREPRPDPRDAPVFRPLMLAHPLEEADLGAIEAAPEDWRAEWKWDGIRVQLAASPGGVRLWSRTGEDVSGAFPELLQDLRFHATLDGELLVMRDGVVAPFADLQQRLNRKVITPRMQRDFPVAVRLYDLLLEGEEDLRPLPFATRRDRLEAWFTRHRPAGMDLSPLVAFSSLRHLAELREGARAASIEGLMLKRADSPYVAGRVKGLWWKWKRAPLTVDAVLMYAQRGHGKRSSYYSDYTFGLWRAAEDGTEELVPVGKAYSGYTDQELVWLDRWIREHTTGRFGPVREVEKALVLEVIFDAAQLSGRHRSGVAMRFPRIARIRRDKPALEADRLETLLAMVENRAEAVD